MPDHPKDRLIIRKYPITPPGGQHVGCPKPGVEVEDTWTGILIRVVGERSQFACKEKAIALMELAIQ